MTLKVVTLDFLETFATHLMRNIRMAQAKPPALEVQFQVARASRPSITRKMRVPQSKLNQYCSCKNIADRS